MWGTGVDFVAGQRNPPVGLRGHTPSFAGRDDGRKGTGEHGQVLQRSQERPQASVAGVDTRRRCQASVAGVVARSPCGVAVHVYCGGLEATASARRVPVPVLVRRSRLMARPWPARLFQTRAESRVGAGRLSPATHEAATRHPGRVRSARSIGTVVNGVVDRRGREGGFRRERSGPRFRTPRSDPGRWSTRPEDAEPERGTCVLPWRNRLRPAVVRALSRLRTSPAASPACVFGATPTPAARQLIIIRPPDRPYSTGCHSRLHQQHHRVRPRCRGRNFPPRIAGPT